MTGAASALGVIRAVSHLALPIRLTAWLCLAENMPSGRATRPNDILTIRGGKTVEVLNTDAEGRLVLADGLVAASEEQPDLIIDIATLTGAATTALGTRTVGVMGNTTEISHLVEVAGTSGETFWHMPLPSELRPLLNSDVADIANVKPGNTAGGMLIAACFLRDFVGNKHPHGDEEPQPLEWIHLDIAGTANNSAGAYGFTGAGPTGVSVRALIDYLASRA
jgi:leucyl aminopeptidase